jgi:hypothetical protein
MTFHESTRTQRTCGTAVLNYERIESMTSPSLVVGIGMLILFALPGRGDVLYDQTPPPGNPNSFDFTDFRVADDFTFSGANSITSILFYYTFAANGAATDLGAMTYAIYNNNAGAVGSLIQSESILSGNITRTGQDALCTTCASAAFTLTTTLNLPAGTYWLELHADSTLTGNNGGVPLDWANVADDFPNSGLISQWDGGSGGVPETSLVSFPGFEQFSFQLSGTPLSSAVPEPGSLALLSLGLLCGGLGLLRRAR